MSVENPPGVWKGDRRSEPRGAGWGSLTGEAHQGPRRVPWAGAQQPCAQPPRPLLSHDPGRAARPHRAQGGPMLAALSPATNRKSGRPGDRLPVTRSAPRDLQAGPAPRTRRPLWTSASLGRGALCVRKTTVPPLPSCLPPPPGTKVPPRKCRRFRQKRRGIWLKPGRFHRPRQLGISVLPKRHSGTREAWNAGPGIQGTQNLI